MKLDFNEVMGKANAYYAEAKLRKAGVCISDAVYIAPEELPQINSDQVKAVLKALIEELNKEGRNGG
jgi:hypothetical protein